MVSLRLFFYIDMYMVHAHQCTILYYSIGSMVLQESPLTFCLSQVILKSTAEYIVRILSTYYLSHCKEPTRQNSSSGGSIVIVTCLWAQYHRNHRKTYGI
ncbi:hypothetical protein P168DRAFT_12716 [Aspergillus campestris IBT 28561]|uniref:Uncharacterized protein n=1 Tax=Aspergillus campestris (strain IBT 28561) TaxID=1392248 RepID=A0A2I1DEF7_ASPC2|nr:uncharacterized protein P168DRAFT_12716 [Aspergillus campestris IBT 28561]PKY08262.1 hypothetical protein P168DRAFT_12716 [Aspergillus campestris IBT 28561]